MAFPFHSEMANRWKRCRILSDREIPRRCHWRRPMLAMVWIASSLQPPRDSTTRGANSTPTARQASARYNLPLLCPGVLAAPTRVSCCRVKMTVTSSSNWEGRCRPLPMLNYLTFELELHENKNLLQSDWTDTRLVCRNRTLVCFECRDAQNERP